MAKRALFAVLLGLAACAAEKGERPESMSAPGSSSGAAQPMTGGTTTPASPPPPPIAINDPKGGGGGSTGGDEDPCAGGKIVGQNGTTGGVPVDTTAHRDPVVGTSSDGDADVSGAVDKDSIRQVVRDHMPKLKYCYESALSRDPKLGALRLMVHFTIDATGAVPASTVDGTTDRKLTACVTAAFGTMKFPAGGSATKVNYPLVFKTQ
nr:AgmX/PglI C-terminal domain-containing protein [Kofleriaceae bacterium]